MDSSSPAGTATPANDLPSAKATADVFDKVLSRALSMTGVIAAIVRHEDPATANLHNKYGGDKDYYSVLAKSVDAATISHQSILSTSEVRVHLDRTHVVIVTLHDDGALGVIIKMSDPGMKSMRRGLRRAWAVVKRS